MLRFILQWKDKVLEDRFVKGLFVMIYCMILNGKFRHGLSKVLFDNQVAN